MNNTNKIKSNIIVILVVLVLGLSFYIVNPHTSSVSYQNINGFSDEVNEELSTFLINLQDSEVRKIAVFDVDGTIIGQVPHYLADEALYSYAEHNYTGKKDPESLSKMKIVEEMIKMSNTEEVYVQNRVRFFSNLTVEEIETIGWDTYNQKYKEKLYPEIKQLISILEDFGFEIWVMTASPEYLYQGFLSEDLGIPKNRIIGMKSVVKNGITTDELVIPATQDIGKEQYIRTYIKSEPLLVVGNSRGDMEMMNTSVGLKMIVNPDDEKKRGIQDGLMNGFTVKSYWEKEGALIVYSNDTRQGNDRYVSEEWGIRVNKSNAK